MHCVQVHSFLNVLNLPFFPTFAENIILQKENKKKDIPKTVQEECPSPTFNVSNTSSVSFTVSPPCDARETTHTVSSIRVPSQQECVGQTAQEMSPPSKPRSVLPRSERVKTSQVSSVRSPCQKETKPSLPSAWPVLPRIPQKASKQVQGQKTAKGHGSVVYTCRLIDCPYHNKPKEMSAVDRELGPVRTSTGPSVKRDPGLEKPMAEPRRFEVQVPYRPKGGPIVDPELVPKRTRAGQLTNKTTFEESTLRYGRQGTFHAVSKGANSTDLSVESFTHTCPHVAQSVHIIRYRCMHVQCNKRQPHSDVTCCRILH